MDRLDDIWKDRFNSDKLPPGEWNSPDELVWDNIAAATVRKKRRLPIFWLWLTGGSAVLIIAIFFGLNLTSKTTVDQSSLTTSLPTEIIKETESTTINENVQNASNQTSTITEIQFDNSKKGTPSTSKNIINLNTSKASKTKKYKALASTQKATEEIIAAKLSDATPKGPTTPKATTPGALNQKEEQAIPFTDLAATVAEAAYITSAIELPTEAIFVETIDLNLDDQKPKTKFKTSLPITITIATGATYWKHQINDQYTSDLSAFDFNYSDNFGWMTDLTVTIPFSKHFSGKLGIQYEQINSTSGHNSALTYDPSAETTTSNNSYALTLATPYGLSGAEFRFNRNSEIGDDPVDLLVDFNSDHSIKNISIPLSLQYSPLGNRRKISPIVGVGFGINYLNSISNKIQSIDTHHSAIQYDDTGVSSFNAPDIRKWHYDYRLMVGTQFRWRNDLALQLSYEYIGGLNPIYKQEDYQTRINRHHISIGLQKTLLTRM